MKIQFFPLDIEYKVEDNAPVIYIYGKASNGEQICVIDKGFKPYFWVFLENKSDLKEFETKAKKLEIEVKTGDAVVDEITTEKKKYLGKEIEAVKVMTNTPSAVPAIREVIKDWDMVKGVREADILYVRRYLIDKGLTPLTLVEAEAEQIKMKSKVPVFEASEIKQFSDATLDKPRVLAVDIETYSPLGKSEIVPEKNPILMIGLSGENFKKVITWKRFKTDLDYVEFVKGEAELIQRFKKIVEEYKPDVLSGYFSDGFDLPYIRTRAEHYKIKLDLGLDHSTMRFGKGRQENVEITGIVHLDVYQVIRRIIGGSLETDSYKLDDVAHELLGKKKIDVDVEDLSRAWDEGEDNLEIFCKYNMQDADLTFELCHKVLPNVIELVKIVGLPLFSISRMSFSQLVEWYLLKMAPQFNEIAPNRPGNEKIVDRREQTYKGAFVFEPKPGLYKDIVVFDFRSLYPTIITSHNICPGTLKCMCCRDVADFAPTDKKEYWFCKKKKGFMSSVLEDIITRRMRVKDMIKEKNSTLLEARAQSLKLLANSFYGYLGFFGARWYSIESARSVTAYGRHYIQKVIDDAKKVGFNVVYGDTDSIFLTLQGRKEKDAHDFIASVNSELPGLMELEFEGMFPAGIFVSAKIGAFGAKKKYALISDKGDLKIKGFEAIRRNWSVIAKEVQQNVLMMVLKDDDKKGALKYVKGVINDLKNKKLDKEKVVIFTQLQRATKDYASIGPHVAVAMHMEELGREVGPGTVIPFIVTPGKGPIRDRAKLPEEVTDDYDPEYYINNQILPSIEKIFEVLGYRVEDLLASKEQKSLADF